MSDRLHVGADDPAEEPAKPRFNRNRDREISRNQEQRQKRREDQAANDGDPHGCAPAIVAADRNGRRQHPGDHRNGGHDDGLSTFVAGFPDRLILRHAVVHHFDREVDEQDRVLCHDPEQHQNADQYEQ